MKLLTGSVLCVLSAIHVFADDVYTNQKTVQTTEEITGSLYVGHADATEAEPATLTVENGGSLTVRNGAYFGNRSGDTVFTVKDGGEFVATNLTDQGIRVGTAADANVSITNRGTMLVQTVEYGDENNSSAVKGGSVEFHNFGSMRVLNTFRIGYSNTGKTSLFHHHEGASLSLEGTGSYKLYVGGRKDGGTWIIDDDVSVASKMWVGLAKGEGVIRLNKNATMTMDPGDEIRLGYEANSTGRIWMANNSRIIGKPVVSVGKDTSSVGSIVMSNNTVIAVTNNYGIGIGSGQKSNGYVELNDNARLLCGNKLTVAGGQSSYGHLVLKDNSQIDVKSDFVVGGGVSSTGIVELCNYEGDFTETPKLATSQNSLGILRLSGTTDFTLPANYKLGNLAGATGKVEVKDDAILRLPSNYLIQGVQSATGVIRLSDRAKIIADSDRFQVGGDSSMTGRLELADDAIVSVTNLCAAYQWQNKNNIYGVIDISDRAVITNVTLLCLGRGSTALGEVNMRGGSIFLDSSHYVTDALLLGFHGRYTTGIIRGWGFLGFDDPQRKMVDYEDAFGAGKTWGSMRFIGQMIADGEDEEQVLDFSRGPVPVSMLSDGVYHNNCGINGFYAVRKGKLKLQRCLPRLNSNHKQVGLQPDYSTPYLVNTFQYTFDDATMSTLGTYVFSELYAADRSDIPTGLPEGRDVNVSAVWRIGHFNSTATSDVADENLTEGHRQNFSSLKLKFHYDPSLAGFENVHRIRVYRCTDTINGGWRHVGSVVPSDSSPYISTATMAPSSEIWNVGWFAIVAEPKKCTAIIVR